MSETRKPRRRALAFSGGGLDSVMQLGVVHALLVGRSAPPDYVVGISSGAINAAALAEVLQAGPQNLPAEQYDALPVCERLSFQVDALRSFIETYLELPRTLVNAMMPDSLEVLARDPLMPLELPIHFDRERQARESANESKAGVVNLLNDLFAIPLTVATGTRIIRRFLGLADANDKPSRLQRLGVKLVNEGKLLALIWSRFTETAALAGTILWAYLIGPNRAALRGVHGAATADRLMRQRRVFAATWRPFRTVLQWFTMAHLFTLFSALWTLLIVPRLVWLLFSGEPRRPWRWVASLRKRLAPVAAWFTSAFPQPVTRVLQYYGLADGLANTDVVRQLLVRCFDAHYYGKTNLASLLDRSLDRQNRPEHATDAYRKRLADYRERTPSLLVAPIAADVETGELIVLDPSVPVVDALLAAMAVVPFLPAVQIDVPHETSRQEHARVFRDVLRAYRVQTERTWAAQKLAAEAARASGDAVPPMELPPPPPVPDEATVSEGGTWFIDGANISNEALAPLISVLRDELRVTNDDSAAVDIYPVSNLPISAGRLPAGANESFDGVLDVVPRALQLKRFRDAAVEQRLTELYTQALPDDASHFEIPLPGGGTRTFVKANVYPLELEKPVGMNYRLLMGQKLEYAEAIYQTIADGCRATLEASLPATIAAAGTGPRVKCGTVIAMRTGDGAPLPGSDPSVGPGLSEVCRRCALHRGAAPEEWTDRVTLNTPGPARQAWPEWPQQRREPQPLVPRTASSSKVMADLGDWPRMRGGMTGTDRPVVSLLFGGGVFRGVFHMGVTNALSEMGIHPDVVAGSSVGSIIAAMIAQVFSNPSGRGRDIAHLAATFLSIDRLVLTDRFADFIRRFTLRAGDTPIALADLDYLFRRYDQGGAGIERLTYISPFELVELVRDLRLEQFAHFISEIRIDVQDFLDRGGVGQEILGSEPLVSLIEHHVLSGRRSANSSIEDRFESFRDCGIYFLATATNLEAGTLEILGEDILASGNHPSLHYGLLASSAFPAVFRPRQSWEIFRDSNTSHQYIDGGVMDNLPLDAVAQFLDRASRAGSGAIARRPHIDVDGKRHAVPHLIFTASLELDPAVRRDKSIGHCLDVAKRAKTFKYNRKMDAFASTQADLRTIHGAYPEPNLLDLHVMAVKPKWLCSTFGFHPMLGFKRRKQKQSIAHGCASTFATVFEMKKTMKDADVWLRGWGVHADLHLDPSCFPFVDREGRPVPEPVPHGTYALAPAAKRGKGECWFRNGVACPFSTSSLQKAGVAKQKIEELEEIYWLCGDPATHQND
jgi:predicted acylesterase/phospholipase RssA